MAIHQLTAVQVALAEDVWPQTMVAGDLGVVDPVHMPAAAVADIQAVVAASTEIQAKADCALAAVAGLTIQEQIKLIQSAQDPVTASLLSPIFQAPTRLLM